MGIASHHAQPESGQDQVGQLAGRFDTTHWSVVFKAGQDDSPPATAALDRLCLTYWYPLYAFVRRRGLAAHDAQDLVQGFFADFLQRNWGQGLSQKKGRFRTFLLTSLEHFHTNEWQKQRAQKRGGGDMVFSLDQTIDEQLPVRAVVIEASAAQAYDRAYAAALVGQVFEQLRADCQRAGKATLFEELRQHVLDGEEPSDAAAIAARLSTTEEAVRQARSRLRHRFRALLKEAVAQTVDDPAQVDEEARYLIAVCVAGASAEL